MSEWVQILPAIGSFLGGPAGGLVGSGIEWLASKFGASDKTVEGIKQTLSGMKPEDLLAMKKLDIEFQEFCLENNIKLQLAQIKVNENEANSTNWFVAGWRPAVGWICAIALGYVSVCEPVLRFVSMLWGYRGAFPVIDTTITIQVLFGMLGLGAMRSFDKQQGNDSAVKK